MRGSPLGFLAELYFTWKVSRVVAGTGLRSNSVSNISEDFCKTAVAQAALSMCSLPAVSAARLPKDGII